MAKLSRRLLLAAGLTGACVAGGCASPAPASPTPRPAAQPLALAPGAYMFRGQAGTADARNQGRIGNAGFIVGESGVIAIDTGTSYRHGQALLAAIAETTSLPVRLALVTHTRPEFLFGGAAFRERGIPVAMHTRTAQLMRARCQGCLDTLRQVVGDGPMQGTEMYSPDQTFDGTHTLAQIGRPVQVHHFGHSSGPGDIAVLDEASGVLFAGGLLDAGRIPDIQDSDLAGWQAALAALRALPVKTIVPGHGPASAPALVDENGRYLAQLGERLRRFVAAGGSLLGAPEAAELPEFARWDQYDLIHPRNASIAYLRFERELMFK